MRKRGASSPSIAWKSFAMGPSLGRRRLPGRPCNAVVAMDFPLSGPAWVAACCRGPEDDDREGRVRAHTSPVYVQFDGKRLQPNASTSAPLFAWLDKVHNWVVQEAKCRDERDRQRLAAVFEAATQELLRRQNG